MLSRCAAADERLDDDDGALVMAMIDFSDIDVSHCGGYSRKENRMRNDSPPFVCIGSRTGCVSTN